MGKCVVHGCAHDVSRDGYELCLPHWKAKKDGGVLTCQTCGGLREVSLATCPACAASPRPRPDTHGEDLSLSSTKIGERLGLSSQKVNLVLSELGWIERSGRGWVPTAQGQSRGAAKLVAFSTGVPYVVWPRTIIDTAVLIGAVAAVKGNATASEPGEERHAESGGATPTPATGQEFRSRFPATLRATDGHQVRSRAEVMICTWLYMQEIAHAYERRLPVDEEAYCDFYLPSKRVYIEYWGLEKDSRYAERKQRKLTVYAKNNLNLVEITDHDIANLDDSLPQKLRIFGIEIQ